MWRYHVKYRVAGLIPGLLYRFLEPLWVQLQWTWDQSSYVGSCSRKRTGTDPRSRVIGYSFEIRSNWDLGSVSTGYSDRPVARAIKIKHAGLNLTGRYKPQASSLTAGLG